MHYKCTDLYVNAFKNVPEIAATYLDKNINNYVYDHPTRGGISCQ